MARELTFLDRENVEQLYANSSENDFRLNDIIVSIVSSDPFIKR